MKPLQLAGHTRPISKVRINREGDLLFTTSKGTEAMVWYLDNGERLGTFNGHHGSVNDYAVDFDTEFGLTASADCKVGLWRVCTGELIRMFSPEVNSSDRCTAVRWSCGDRKFLVCTIGKRMGRIFIYDFDRDLLTDQNVPNEEISYSMKMPVEEFNDAGKFTGHTGNVTDALWGPINETVFTSSQDGTIRKWDVEEGRELIQTSFNPELVVEITSMSFSRDKTLLVASGRDCTARLFEAETLQQLKIYVSDKPLNCAVIHPKLNVVMVAGGQSARDAALTDHRKGKFEVQFFHTIFEEKIGEVRTGHFSPINCLAITMDASHFVTGSEEGNCRIFKFDNDFARKFQEVENSFTNQI